jgi:hypothetical protein
MFSFLFKKPRNYSPNTDSKLKLLNIRNLKTKVIKFKIIRV